MKGIELIKKAMKLEEVDRIPWVPFVGVHAGNLLGLKASEYLKSADHIVNGVNKAIDLYDPDGIPIVFDLQIEAEALGCQLAWSDDNPPAVISHPLQDGEKIENLEIPCVCQGRIQMVMDATARLRDQHPHLALYGLITGPFTLALHLYGTNIFTQMMMDQESVHKIMAFTTKVAKKMAELYLEAGADVIAIVDPMTSQIDPDSFECFVSPYVSEINKFIKNAGALSSLFVCGNAQQNIEVMCKTQPNNISIDENIPLDFVRDTALKYGVSFGGNLKLTLVLLMGDPETTQRHALECMDIGGKKGFILAPGCDLAMKTPVENLEAVSKLVHDENLQGQIRASVTQNKDIKLLDLSQHWSQEKVIIDVVTLDSSSCAPCQYMYDAVAKAAEPFKNKVEFKEHSIKKEEGIQMMASLGVKAIPTIVIDGNIEFSSQIPPIQDIKNRIEYYISKKGI